MKKVTLGPQTLIYPMPALLIGTSIKNKPNFMTAAWSGIACSNPPMITVAIQHHRHTHKGIRQNMTFSVNVPSTAIVREVDFCGIISGSKNDKIEICQFDIFYGKHAKTPLIEQCPINLECSVEHILHLGSHSLFVGKIVETHISNKCLTNGKPDVSKIMPFVYVTAPDLQYRALGDVIANAFSVGKEITC